MADACLNNYFDEKQKLFVCKLCDYNTSRLYNLKTHFSTKKHITTENLKKTSKTSSLENHGDVLVETFNDIKHVCCCGKSYSHRQSLYKHRKNCSTSIENSETTNENKKIQNINILNKQHNQETGIDEINELKQKILILESIISQSYNNKDVTTTASINNVNNSITKSSITNSIVNSTLTKNEIKVYLNEKCADAISIQDFINQLTITLDDLKNGKNNSTECIINILETNLKPLSISTRPIHYLEKYEWILNDNHEWKEDNGNTLVEKTHYKIQKECINNYKKCQDENSTHLNADEQLELISFGTKTLTKTENDKIKKHLVNKCKLVV